MLTPCPHCDQQVTPDGDGACPLCGGAVLNPDATAEQDAPERAHTTEESNSEEPADGHASPKPREAEPAEAAPVWAQTADDLVAPDGLVGDEGDEDDGSEDDVQEATDEKREPMAPAACAASDEPLTLSAKPGLL